MNIESMCRLFILTGMQESRVLKKLLIKSKLRHQVRRQLAVSVPSVGYIGAFEPKYGESVICTNRTIA
jgi:hypothetical protein